MSDETEGPKGSPGHGPGDDAHIRALLAELGSGPEGESMPPEVAARLDDTLARLVAERAEAGDPDAGSDAGSDEQADTGNVVPLRRRWSSQLTVAAAAVIVLGAGGVAATNLGVLGGSSSDSATSSDAGGSSATRSEAVAPSTATPDAATRKATRQVLALPRVRSIAFTRDVTSLVGKSRAGVVAPLSGDQEMPGESQSDPAQDSGGGPGEARPPAATLGALSCQGPTITDAAVASPIAYDGRVAVLVVHPEIDGQQLVEAWNCQGSRTLDSTTITP